MAMPYSEPSQDPSEKRRSPGDDAQLKMPSPAAPPAEQATAPSGSAMPPIPLTPETLTFRDERGALWWAHEVSGEAIGSSRPLCLLLISGTKLRRIGRYPPDWRSLTPAELLALPDTAD